MADNTEQIGSVSVAIEGDYSPLLQSFSEAQSAAENAGGDIAAALETGAAGVTPLDDAAQQLGQTLETTGEEAGTASEKVEDLGRKMPESGRHAEESAGMFGELSSSLLDLAMEMGATIGAAELIKETFSAFSEVESATVALTALTGSAEDAQTQIDGLRTLALDENLSFPALLEANQRMVAFGFEAGDISPALQAAADAAAAVNSTVEQTSNAIDRMAASGMAGARQLTQLGLTTGDLAQVMGVAEGDVKKAFTALDQETRLQVLTAALDKFSGQAQVAASTLKGQWQGVKTAFEETFVKAGELLEPIAKQFLTFFKSIADAAGLWVDVIRTTFQEVEYYFTRVVHGAEAAQKLAAQFAAEEAKREKSAEAPAKTGPNLDELRRKVHSALSAEGFYDVSEARKPIQDVTSDMSILSEQLDRTLKSQKATTDSIVDYGDSLKEAGVQLDAAALKGQYFYETALAAADGIDKAESSTPPLIDAFGHLIDTSEQAGKAQDEIQKKSVDLANTLQGITGKVTVPFDALHASVAQIDRDLASGNFAQIQYIINRLATDDLPTAVAQQERFVAALEAGNSSLQRTAEAQQKLLELQMQLAESQDRDTTRIAAKLALVDLETRNLAYDTKNVWGSAFTDVANSADHALGNIGGQVSKLAIEGGRFSQVWHAVWTKFTEDILSAAINALVKMGEEFVLEKLTEKVTASTTDVSEVAGAAAVGGANAAAATAAIPIVGPAMAAAAGAAMYAEILGTFGPLAAFEKGGFVPEDMFALVHKGEYVATASQVADASHAENSAGGGLTLNIGSIHGVMRDTVDALAMAIVKKSRFAGSFR